MESTSPIEDDWRSAYHVDDFMSLHLYGKSPQTVKYYTEHLRLFITYTCEGLKCTPGDIDFSRLTCIHFNDEDEVIYDQVRVEFVQDFLGTICAPSIRRLAQISLRAYFQFLLDSRLIRYNPVPSPIPEYDSSQSIRSVDLNELEKLVRYLRTQRHPCGYAVLIEGAAGLRIGEVLAMRVGDVFSQRHGWVAAIQRPESNKSKRATQLPIPPADDIMTEWFEWRSDHHVTSEYLFADKRNKPLTKYMVRNYLKKACNAVGISPIQTHDMRRGYATLMDRVTDNQAVLAQALHHSPRSGIVTRRYISRVKLHEVDNYLSNLTVTRLGAILAKRLADEPKLYKLKKSGWRNNNNNATD